MKLPTVKERKRFSSPAITPQALAWDGKQLWISSRNLGLLYKVQAGLAVTTISAAGIDAMEIVEEVDPPGIVWAAVATNGAIHTTIGKGLNDDRYVYRYGGNGRFEKLFACPDFTGSFLSFGGEHYYLSQWYKGQIHQMDDTGKIGRTIEIGAEICGHTFVDGRIYVLRGAEKLNEEWCIAQLDPREETPEIKDLAIVPFACRSLTFDGEHFWANHRVANETVAFDLPK